MKSMKSVTTIFTALVLGASSLGVYATPHHQDNTRANMQPETYKGYHVIPNPKPHYIKHKPSHKLAINLHGLKKRIKHGIKSGELTHYEEKTLKQRLRQLRKGVKRAKADHYISYSEKTRLERKAKRLSRSIYRKKHNNAKRYYQPHHH